MRTTVLASEIVLEMTTVDELEKRLSKIGRHSDSVMSRVDMVQVIRDMVQVDGDFELSELPGCLWLKLPFLGCFQKASFVLFHHGEHLFQIAFLSKSSSLSAI